MQERLCVLRQAKRLLGTATGGCCSLEALRAKMGEDVLCRNATWYVAEPVQTLTHSTELGKTRTPILDFGGLQGEDAKNAAVSRDARCDERERR